MVEWKVEKSLEIEDGLVERVLDKIADDTLTAEDFRDYFTVFVYICNTSEDVQDEIEDFNQIFQIKLDNQPMLWISIEDQQVGAGSGIVEHPTITLNFPADIARGIFTGMVDPTAAYMNGEIQVDGVINDAFQLKNLVELVLDELE